MGFTRVVYLDTGAHNLLQPRRLYATMPPVNMKLNPRLISVVILFVLSTGYLVPSLQVGGRKLYFSGDYLRDSDTDWLVAYISEQLDKSSFTAAGKAIRVLEQYCPEEKEIYSKCYRARFHYATESHRGGYKEFEELFKAEEAAFTARGAPAPDETAKANNAIISETIIETISTANSWGTEADVAKISNYDSPTDFTAKAEMKMYQYDLRWCVNLAYLIRKYDPKHFGDAVEAIQTILNEKRTYRAYYEEVTLPKTTKDRARDEVRGSVTAYGAILLPGAIGREIHRAYNLEGFSFCIQRPVSIYDMRVFANSCTKVKENSEIVITPYENEGFVAYRAKGSCTAEADIALSDVLRYFNIKPYSWAPYYGYVSGDRERKVKEETDIEEGIDPERDKKVEETTSDEPE
ncbi:MAG: hypothetical protein GY771_06775 [bacterium]|nr:hypothetical protein [bacterium]